MTNINIEVYLNGCKLTINVLNGDSNTYMVLLNTDTKEVSPITKYAGSFEYELESDGIYKIYVIKDANARFEHGMLFLDAKPYNAEQLVDAIESDVVGFATAIYDTEELFCNCKLQKCLFNLQMKVFQEMLKTCGSGKCAKLDEMKSQRDFLFIANWLMEHLAEKDKVDQLHRVYEGVASCGSICSNLLDTTNNCGCNG